MLENFSIDQVLMKAKFHVKNNEFNTAKKLFESILEKFPNNVRVKKELNYLETHKLSNIVKNAPQEAINKLIELYNDGKFLSVVKQAKTLTDQYPHTLIIWELLGASATKTKNFDLAIEAFKNIIVLKPLNAEAFFNLAITFQDQKKLDEAIEVYRKLISFRPDYVEAYNNMGNALQDQGKFEEAIMIYKKTIKIDIDDSDTHFNMGIAFEAQRKLDEAIKCFKKALSIKPSLIIADYNIGNILLEKNSFNEAIQFYKKCIMKNPNFAEAYCNIGVALEKQGKFKEALKYYNKSVMHKSDYAEAYCNMGIAFQNLGQVNKAIQAYKKAILLKPDFPEAHQFLSYSLLNNDSLKEGLDEYEWRWKSKKFKSKRRCFSKPLLDSVTSLDGKKLLLWCEQGIADTINWSSCLSLVIPRTKKIILECQEKLVPLLEVSFPDIEVKAENTSFDKNRNDFDFHLPMGSLYRCFIEEISKIKSAQPFLIPDPVRVKFWKERLLSIGKPPYIGISWKSSNTFLNRQQNYAKLIDLLPLLKIPNVTFINLQYTDFEDELTKIHDEIGVTVHNFSDLDHYNNINDVAALIKALDVVVTTKVTLLSISAGVGTSTKLASWRESTWNNILWNPLSMSVDKFERNTFEPWENTFSLIANDISYLQQRYN